MKFAHLMTGIWLCLSLSAWAANPGRELKVLSFNAWVLRLAGQVDIAKEIDERVKIIPAYVSATGADIVAIQEVWDPDLRDQLIRDLKSRGFRFIRYHDNPSGNLQVAPLSLRGLFGNGLLIASKLPLKSGSGIEFSRNTALDAFHAEAVYSEPVMYSFNDFTRLDEFAVAKGGLHTEVCVPSVGWVDFYAAHLGAVSFDEETGDYVPEQRQAQYQQAAELANWIQKSQRNPLKILAVDTNAHPLQWSPVYSEYVAEPSPIYGLLTGDSAQGALGMTDTYMAANHLTLEQFRKRNVFTFDRHNPYVAAGEFANIPDEFIDFVLVDQNQSTLVPVRADRVFVQKPQGKGVDAKIERLSDHYGMLTTLSIQPPYEAFIADCVITQP